MWDGEFLAPAFEVRRQFHAVRLPDPPPFLRRGKNPHRATDRLQGENNRLRAIVHFLQFAQRRCRRWRARLSELVRTNRRRWIFLPRKRCCKSSKNMRVLAWKPWRAPKSRAPRRVLAAAGAGAGAAPDREERRTSADAAVWLTPARTM